MITIHIHVRNHLYFLIIKLYKFILYTQTFTHIIIHTNNIIKKSNAHNQTHSHTKYKFIKNSDTCNLQTLALYS